MAVRVWVSVSACCGRPVAHVCTQVWLSDWWFPDAEHRGCVTQDKSGEGKPQGDRFHVLHGWLSMAASGIRSNDPLLANRIPAPMSLDSAGLTASGDLGFYIRPKRADQRPTQGHPPLASLAESKLTLIDHPLKIINEPERPRACIQRMIPMNSRGALSHANETTSLSP
jgi:hypothetical protein